MCFIGKKVLKKQRKKKRKKKKEKEKKGQRHRKASSIGIIFIILRQHNDEGEKHVIILFQVGLVMKCISLQKSITFHLCLLLLFLYSDILT